MFDARSILDILLGGGPGGRPRQGRPVDPTVFKDMLDRLGDQPSMSGSGQQPQPGGAAQAPQSPGTPSPQPVPGGPGGMSLEDLLRTILTGGTSPQGGTQPGPAGGGQQGPAVSPEVSKDLQDLLRQILQDGSGQGSSSQGSSSQGSSAQSSGGTRIPINRLMGEAEQSGAPDEGSAESVAASLGEILKQVFGQATAGAREGATRIDEATGLSERARETLGQVTGRTPEELVAQLKKLITENQVAAGAALGGLGALVLGTRAGRSLAATALRLGSLALIGGLAYKAVQNYQQGRPILSSGRPGEKQTLVPAPIGSGFEPDAVR